MEMPGTGSWSPNHWVRPHSRKQHWAALKQWCSSGRNRWQNWKLADFQKHGANKVINLIAKYFPHRTLNHKVYMQLVCRPCISLTRRTVLIAPGDRYTNPLCHLSLTGWTVLIAPGDGHTNPPCHPVRHWYHLCSNLTQEWLPITETYITHTQKKKTWR